MTSTIAVADPPSSKEEAWRYTPVKEVVSRVQKSSSAKRAHKTTITNSELELLAGNLTGVRIVFVNGFYDSELSNHDSLPDGLFCGLASDTEQLPQDLVSQTENVRTVEGLYSLDDEYDVAVIIAQDGLKLDEPIHIVHVATQETSDTGSRTISHPRTVIDIGDNSNLAIVETFCGSETSTMTDSSTTIRLGNQANLDQCRIQNESPSATHIGNTKITQGVESHMKMTSITIGSDIARNAIDVHLNSTDAKLELTGVNLTTANQVHDTQVSVDHDASRCASNQRFFGVVDDHGHTSFSGEIIVQHGTVGTDAHQTNKNLVLDDNAKADTRPWLRIFADDVQCTHGATVGRLDDDSLFYLRSRGIELAQAQTMLIDAFIHNITESITNESVRTHVDALIDKTTAMRSEKSKKIIS